jgi:hypothetical protein
MYIKAFLEDLALPRGRESRENNDELHVFNQSKSYSQRILF